MLILNLETTNPVMRPSHTIGILFTVADKDLKGNVALLPLQLAGEHTTLRQTEYLSASYSLFVLITTMQRYFVFLLCCQRALGFQPIHKTRYTTAMGLFRGESDELPISSIGSSVDAMRKMSMPLMTGFAVFSAMAVRAEEAAVTAETKVELGPVPDDFGITADYYSDCTKVVKHMRYACQMEKGNPKLIEIAQKTKDEMNEFVSYYRRFTSVAGRQSFSLLYTSISVLAGHYTSYGTKFPVPEKRRKRLLQEFNDIEKNIPKTRALLRIYATLSNQRKHSRIV
eukprot:gene4275-8510_t